MAEFSGMDARTAIIAFWETNASTLPEKPRTVLRDALAGQDALNSIVTGIEALYASRSDLNTEGLELLSDLSRFVSRANFYGKGMRSAIIAGVAARIMDGGHTEAEGDPELDVVFIEATAPESDVQQGTEEAAP